MALEMMDLGIGCRALTEELLHTARCCVQSVPPPRLACPACRWIPSSPVTLPCGHTLCRPCLATSCPVCSAPVPPPHTLKDNVVVKAALTKWFAPELAATKLRENAAQSLRLGELSSALDKLQSAVDSCGKDHLSLEIRSEAYFRMGDYESALRDAQLAIKLRPLWPKGYYRRGAALVELGFYEEALISYLIFVALSKHPEAVKNEITMIIYNILSSAVKSKDSDFDPSMLFPWFYHASDPRNMHHQMFKGPKTPPMLMESKKLRAVIEHAFQEIEMLKRIDVEAGEVELRLESIETGDFECVLCCRVLWRPVTTPCGHMYCSMCLDRCLDYSSNCPLCMTSLADYLSTSERHVTELIEVALVMSLPQEYACRLLSHQQEQTALLHISDLPVFVCTTAFPSVPCPLFVFEPKYRLLVRRAVASGQRRFAMTASVSHLPGPNRYAEYGTVLEIKDWVLMNDGCSILSNVGGRRFRVISRAERDGYDTAQVQYIIDEPIPFHQHREVSLLHDSVLERGIRWFHRLAKNIQEEIIRVFGRMPSPEPNWLTLSDGPAWTWWLLAILPLGQQLQIGILGTTSLEKRLRAIDKTLRHLDSDISVCSSSSHHVQQDLGSTVSLV